MSMSGHLSKRESQILNLRFTVLRYFMLTILVLLFTRFWILQVIQYNKWQYVAQENRIRHISKPASRGLIGDRYSRILARDRTSFNINLIPADVDDQSIQRLAQYLELTPETLRERLKKGRRWSPFIAVLVARDISRDKFARVAENLHSLSGVIEQVAPAREYPYGRLFAHLIGYLGEINSEQLAKPEFADYRQGQQIGRKGLESVYEKVLRGTDGTDIKLVDARGRDQPMAQDQAMQRELNKYINPAIPGRQIDLTVDLDLQNTLVEQFKDKTGAAVVLDVRTGEILALVNAPSFDPEEFLGGIARDKWNELLNARERPLLNRAIQGAYPPGSIFKMVTAAAALEDGKISFNEQIHCPGYHILGGHRFNCWRRAGHGRVDVEKAIVQSCDVFFYQAGARLGIDKLAKMSFNFGLGKITGLGIPGEKPGLIPTSAWKEKTYGERWYPGETLPCAIGQGFVLVTPLQAALIPMAVANDGRLMRPQIVLRVQDENGDMQPVFEPEVLHDEIYSAQTAALLRQAMSGVVNTSRGTAYWTVRSDKVQIAGKTGTAQVSEKYVDAEDDEIPDHLRDHAWFVAYAPADKPEIALSVLVEHGGHGSSAAGPIAKALIETYMELKISRAASAPFNSGD